MGVDIYLAGAEVTTLTQSLIDNGAKWVLYSFWYLYHFRQIDYIHKVQDENPQIKWLLDSGAFTYFANVKAGKPLPPAREYVRLYFKYLEHHAHRWCMIAEPDLDVPGSGTDFSSVWGWWREMKERWPDRPIMPVFHPWRGWNTWKTYLDDPDIGYLAIGSNSGGVGEMRKMAADAIRNGKQVHGFAYTKVNTALKWVELSSVDSTSWLMGQKYGTLYLFAGGKLHVLDSSVKDERRLWRRHLEAVGCDPAKIEADDVAEVRKANVIAWRDLAERLHLMKVRRERAIKGLLARPDRHAIDVVRAVGATVGLDRSPVLDPRPRGQERSAWDGVTTRGMARDPADDALVGRSKAMPRPLAGFGVRPRAQER